MRSSAAAPSSRMPPITIAHVTHLGRTARTRVINCRQTAARLAGDGYTHVQTALDSDARNYVKRRDDVASPIVGMEERKRANERTKVTEPSVSSRLRNHDALATRAIAAYNLTAFSDAALMQLPIL